VKISGIFRRKCRRFTKKVGDSAAHLLITLGKKVPKVVELAEVMAKWVEELVKAPPKDLELLP
jgi:hypothetical protein